MYRRLNDLIEQSPWLVAIVTALVALMIVHASTLARADKHQAWPEYVTLGLTAYAVVVFALSFRWKALAGPQAGTSRWAVAFAPAVAATFDPTSGGSDWAAWTALGACWALLAAFAFTTSAGGPAD
jgi:hypothetical protein